MNYGKAFDYDGNRKAQIAQYADAKDTLTNAPENAKKVWSKCADDMKKAAVGNPGDSGAFYSPYDKRTHFQSYKKMFAESSYQRKNTAFYHEYAHNIDHLLGGGGRGNYYSTTFVDENGHLFIQVLEREIGDTLGAYYLQQNGIDLYDAVKAAQNGAGGMGFGNFTRQMLRSAMSPDEYRAIRGMLVDAGDDDSVLRPLVDKYLIPQFKTELRTIIGIHPEIADSFCDYVKSTHSIYETTDVSDAFGNYMCRKFHKNYSHPFGVGHSYSYQMDASNLPIETFAEFYAATVTQSDSLVGIKEMLPESYEFFLKMLESAAK